MFIYKITNLINNKFYIGKTIGSIEKRFNAHARKSNKKMYIASAIQKYGKENFKIELLDDSAETLEELNNKEIFYIKKLNPDYNVAKGGDGGAAFAGHKHTLETRKLMSEKRMGIRYSEETLENMRKGRRTWKHSKETVEKYTTAQAKYYYFIDPNGNPITIHNLNKFCRENNLHSSSMRHVYFGEPYQYHCKGYRKAPTNDIL